MFILNLLLFLVSLSLLIFVHELGHFVFAKIFKVYCHEFSLGMGPAIVQKKFKKDPETTYSLRCLPIGGYVAMAGETAEDEKDQKIPYERTINGISAWKRAIVVVAGATVNFLFALLLLFVFVFSGGLQTPTQTANIIVEPDSVAFVAGLKDDDLVKNIIITGDNNSVCGSICVIESNNQLFDYLKDSAPNFIGATQTIEIDYLRDGVLNNVSLERSYSEESENSTLLGIGQATVSYHPGFFEGFKLTFQKFGEIITTMFGAIKTLFTKAGMSQVGGPIQIYKISTQQAGQGFLPYLFFLSLLSINLGFFNLFPIPGLDGSRFIIAIVETITRKKVNVKVESYLNAIGIIFLLTIMVLVTIKDIVGLF